MMIVGVDPGKSGAICMLGVAAGLFEMPLISGQGRDEYNVTQIVKLLKASRPDCVFVERLQPMPARFGGAIANYQRGYGVALFEGICSALELPFRLVSPKVWQKEMLDGTPGDDTKQRAILAAKRLFPSVDLRRTERCTTDHDGFADALLIAGYGTRLLNAPPKA